MIKYLTNIDFVLWSLKGQPAGSKWSSYAEKHPGDAQFQRALSVVKRLSFCRPSLSEQEKQQLYNAILADGGLAKARPRSLWPTVRRVAMTLAACLVVGVAGVALFNGLNNQEDVQAVQSALPQLSSIAMPESITILSDGQQQSLMTILARVECNEQGDIVVAGQRVASACSSPFDILVPASHRAVVTLADNTKIWLNENTRLRVNSQCGSGARSVEIDGEGYFDVTHNPDSPFRVLGQDLVAVVKGTSFDIRSTSAPDATQYVVLVEGQVDVDMPAIGESVSLAPSQILNYNNDCYMTTKTDVSSYTSWREGSIAISSDSIVDVITKIADYYAIEVEYDAGVSQLSCSGRLVLFDDVKQTLDVLTNIIPISYKWRGKKLYIESN